LFPSDPLSNEHLSSPIHPTTLADFRTDPFASFCRSPSRHSRQCCRSFLQLECASPLTCIHCSHCCSSTEWLCLSVAPLQSESTDGQLLLKILPSYGSICSRSPFSLLVSLVPSRSSSLQKDLLPIMNLRSGFKKGRNSNILGSISMINMRSMSR